LTSVSHSHSFAPGQSSKILIKTRDGTIVDLLASEEGGFAASGREKAEGEKEEQVAAAKRREEEEQKRMCKQKVHNREEEEKEWVLKGTEEIEHLQKGEEQRKVEDILKKAMEEARKVQTDIYRASERPSLEKKKVLPLIFQALCFDRLQQAIPDGLHLANPIEWARCNRKHVVNLAHLLSVHETHIGQVYPVRIVIHFFDLCQV
jgi:hypothetical protein